MDHSRTLDGNWELAWCPHGQISVPNELSDLPFYPATVPGRNIEDLLDNIIRDPFVDFEFRGDAANVAVCKVENLRRLLKYFDWDL